MANVQASNSTLAEVETGQYRCDQIQATGQNAVRLKRMGICEGRTIELVSQGDPMVLRIGATRIGLSRQLAGLVLIDADL